MFALPPRTVEHVELDFKQEPHKLGNGKVDSRELAKDIAAMANALGGHIVVGAIATTNRYMHLAPERRRTAMALLETGRGESVARSS